MVEIKNIRWNERKREFYAHLYIDGELAVMAHLDYCIECAKIAAADVAVVEE